jgi:hypothetical protein
VIATLRRLNDRERYWGLTWPGWLAVAVGGAVLYGAVKLSPFAVKPTVTIVVLLVAVGVMIVLGVSGQALSPARHLAAIAAYRQQPKRWTLPDRPDRHGLVLTTVPPEALHTSAARGGAGGQPVGEPAGNDADPSGPGLGEAWS